MNDSMKVDSVLPTLDLVVDDVEWVPRDPMMGRKCSDNNGARLV